MQSCYSPLQLLLPDCVRFNCSLIASTSAALPNCVRFNCCSPIASNSADALRLHLLQLLLAACVHFGCCSPIASGSTAPRLCLLQLLSPIASASTAAPRLRPLTTNAAHQLFWKIPTHATPESNVLEHSSWSSRLSM